ncbi:MAG: hypothetical protein BGO10_02020 [Chlamydia sp. 32-24]|nr:MAG: hypothetical protein BGO10_02020 [Chlamydia sp. 32-24]
MVHVQFLRFSTNQEKLIRICQLVTDHFNKKEKIILFAPNEEVAKYVDLLLWRLPEDGFLPHLYSDKPSNNFIQITTLQENLNQASFCLNLCPGIGIIMKEFTVIYDILDGTHESKFQLSQRRQQEYVKQHLTCHVI